MTRMVITFVAVAALAGAAPELRAQAVSTRPVPPARGIATDPPPPAKPAPRPVPIDVFYPNIYAGQTVLVPGGYIQQAPPVAQMEQQIRQPYAASAWVPGRYQWNGAQYFWVAGQWVPLPGGYTQWVPGKWEYNDYGWFWISGYWR